MNCFSKALPERSLDVFLSPLFSCAVWRHILHERRSNLTVILFEFNTIISRIYWPWRGLFQFYISGRRFLPLNLKKSCYRRFLGWHIAVKFSNFVNFVFLRQFPFSAQFYDRRHSWCSNTLFYWITVTVSLCNTRHRQYVTSINFLLHRLTVHETFSHTVLCGNLIILHA